MKSKTLVSSIFSVGVATLLTKLVGLIVLGYPARILGPENYGLYSFAISVTAYANICLVSGLTVWGTRHIAQNKAVAGETVGSINFVRLSLAIFSYLVIYIFVATHITDSIEKYVLLICGLTLFTNALSIDWALNGLEKVSLPPWLNFINTLLATVFLLVFVGAPDDIIIYSLIAPVATVLVTFISYYLIWNSGVRVLSPSANIAFEAIKQSKLLILIFSLITVGHYAANILIKNNLGSVSLGIFMAAYYLFELTSSIPSLIGTIVFPRISRYVATDVNKAILVAKKLSQIYMILGFAIVSILYAEAEFIIGFVYGEQYAESANLFKIMCLGLVFNFALCSYTNILMAFSEDKTILFVTLTSSILAVILGVTIIPIYGLTGAAVIIAVIDAVGWFVCLGKYRSVIGGVNFKKWTQPAFGGLLVIALSMLDTFSHIHVVCRVVLYFLILFSISYRDLIEVFNMAKHE